MEKQQRLQSLDSLRGFDMLLLWEGRHCKGTLYIISNGFFESLARAWSTPSGMVYRITTRFSPCFYLLPVYHSVFIGKTNR